MLAEWGRCMDTTNPLIKPCAQVQSHLDSSGHGALRGKPRASLDRQNVSLLSVEEVFPERRKTLFAEAAQPSTQVRLYLEFGYSMESGLWVTSIMSDVRYSGTVVLLYNMNDYMAFQDWL